MANYFENLLRANFRCGRMLRSRTSKVGSSFGVAI